MTLFNMDELLSNIDIIDLLELMGIELHLMGREYHGRCPLHQGSSQTVFSVNRDKKGRTCRACHATNFSTDCTFCHPNVP